MRQAVGFQNLDHLVAFVVGAFDNLHLLAPSFALVVLGVAFGSEVSA